MELLGQDAGLDHRDEIRRIDLQHPVHAFQGEGDAAADWNTTADVAVTGTARGDGDPVVLGKFQQGRYRAGGEWQGHGLGFVRGEPFVAGILLKDGIVEKDFARQELAQACEGCGGGSGFAGFGHGAKMERGVAPVQLDLLRPGHAGAGSRGCQGD